MQSHSQFWQDFSRNETDSKIQMEEEWSTPRDTVHILFYGKVIYFSSTKAKSNQEV